MNVVSKILAIIVMSLIALFVVAFPINLIVNSFSPGPHPSTQFSTIAILVALAVTILIALLSRSSRTAWGRLCLFNGLASLALPLAGIAFTAILGYHSVQNVPLQGASTSAAQAGTAIGVGLAGTAVSATLGFIGFFLGAIFLVLAYFLLRARPA
jgi:hypothetical protein